MRSIAEGPGFRLSAPPAGSTIAWVLGGPDGAARRQLLDHIPRVIHDQVRARLLAPGLRLRARPDGDYEELRPVLKKLRGAAARQRKTDARCAVYFAIPEPFELEAFRSDGLDGTLPCEARACWLSLSARVFRSCFRPLASRSENSRGSIEESKLVSGEGFDHRLQARRIKRKMTRRFLISRPTQKPPYARWERRANRGRSFADCR